MTGEGNFAVWLQFVPNTAPVELLSIGAMQASDQVFEADVMTYRILKDALGLRDTSAAHLVATLLSRAIKLKEFKNDVLGRHSY